MSAGKHTPGPWRWIGPNQLWGGRREMDEVLKAGDDRKPYGKHSPLIEHHYDEETAAANARLISAAPDLLEALEMLANALDFDDLRHDDQRKAYAAMNAAIAKATA